MPAQPPLVDFLIIGAPKAATTWLADSLREHPGVFIPAAKELRYFCGTHLHRGLDWYRAQLAEGVRGQQRIGEASPSYFGSAEAIERIHALLPGCRLIVSLRHPVDQAYSFYWHQLSRGQLPASTRFVDFFREQRPRAGYYGRRMEHVLACFPQAQILTLIYERDIQATPARGIRACQQHLGLPLQLPAGLQARRNTASPVSPWPALDGAIRRAARPLPGAWRAGLRPLLQRMVDRLPGRRRYRPLDTTQRQELLWQHCRDDLQRLVGCTGLDLSAWGLEGLR